MPDTASPQLSIKLTPVYDNDFGSAQVTYMSIKLTLGGLCGGLQGGSPLDENKATHKYYFQDMVTDRYVENGVSQFDNIGAYDDLGPLAVSVGHAPGESHSLVWKTDRLTQGDVTICYDAIPAGDDTLALSASTLRRDNGGLVGIAASFIPLPAVKEPVSVDVVIEWDVSQAPKGIRALSSFGEGKASRKAACLTALSECVFMVGQIQTHGFVPPSPLGEVPAAGLCGIHWLGTLPDNVSSMREFVGNMLPRLSAFFKDDDTGYLVFMRRVPRGLGATRVTGGTLIDYDDDSREEHDWDLVRLFNSSMMATWAHLDPEDDGASNDWFTQGISHIYTIYLPYRFGQRPPDYFRATLNGYLSSYFTNPFVTYPLDKIPPDSWYGQSALAMRSCIYMIRMDCFTRRASVARNAGVLRPIDGIVADIRRRRLRGDKVQAREWLEYLGHWIGEESAQEHFRRMKSGHVMDLEDMKTAFDGIQPEDQRVLDMGFDQSSLMAGIVSGVVGQSEAARLRREGW
ncbi:hypothetical protein V8C37DRAFT_364319 [Trichoderma ceciliae]